MYTLKEPGGETPPHAAGLSCSFIRDDARTPRHGCGQSWGEARPSVLPLRGRKRRLYRLLRRRRHGHVAG
jgi:hypothetical protein